MKNYSQKTSRKMTRYRTPSSFRFQTKFTSQQLVARIQNKDKFKK